MDHKVSPSAQSNTKRWPKVVTRLQFGLPSLLFGVLLVAVVCGWVTDHRRLKSQLDANLTFIDKCRRVLVPRIQTGGLGRPLTDFPEVAYLANDVTEFNEGFGEHLRAQQNPPGKTCMVYTVYLPVDPSKRLKEGDIDGIMVYAVDDTIVFIKETSPTW
jgi:hypothetical protein